MRADVDSVASLVAELELMATDVLARVELRVGGATPDAGAGAPRRAVLLEPEERRAAALGVAVLLRAAQRSAAAVAAAPDTTSVPLEPAVVRALGGGGGDGGGGGGGGVSAEETSPFASLLHLLLLPGEAEGAAASREFVALLCAFVRLAVAASGGHRRAEVLPLALALVRRAARGSSFGTAAQIASATLVECACALDDGAVVAAAGELHVFLGERAELANSSNGLLPPPPTHQRLLAVLAGAHADLAAHVAAAASSWAATDDSAGEARPPRGLLRTWWATAVPSWAAECWMMARDEGNLQAPLCAELGVIVALHTLKRAAEALTAVSPHQDNGGCAPPPPVPPFAALLGAAAAAFDFGSVVHFAVAHDMTQLLRFALMELRRAERIAGLSANALTGPVCCACDAHGCTPLGYAVARRNSPALRLLLLHGASTLQPTRAPRGAITPDPGSYTGPPPLLPAALASITGASASVKAALATSAAAAGTMHTGLLFPLDPPRAIALHPDLHQDRVAQLRAAADRAPTLVESIAAGAVRSTPSLLLTELANRLAGAATKGGRGRGASGAAVLHHVVSMALAALHADPWNGTARALLREALSELSPDVAPVLREALAPADSWGPPAFVANRPAPVHTARSAFDDFADSASDISAPASSAAATMSSRAPPGRRGSSAAAAHSPPPPRANSPAHPAAAPPPDPASVAGGVGVVRSADGLWRVLVRVPAPLFGCGAEGRVWCALSRGIGHPATATHGFACGPLALGLRLRPGDIVSFVVKVERTAGGAPQRSRRAVAIHPLRSAGADDAAVVVSVGGRALALHRACLCARLPLPPPTHRSGFTTSEWLARGWATVAKGAAGRAASEASVADTAVAARELLAVADAIDDAQSGDCRLNAWLFAGPSGVGAGGGAAAIHLAHTTADCGDLATAAASMASGAAASVAVAPPVVWHRHSRRAVLAWH